MSARKVFWIVLGVTILIWGGSLGYLFFWPESKTLQPSLPQGRSLISPSPRCYTYDEVARKIASERKPSEFAIQIGTFLSINTADKIVSFIAPSWKGPLQYPYIEEPIVWLLDREIKDAQEFVTFYPRIIKGEIIPAKISLSQLLSEQKTEARREERGLMRPRPALLVLKHLGQNFKQGMGSTSGVILIVVGK